MDNSKKFDHFEVRTYHSDTLELSVNDELATRANKRTFATDEWQGMAILFFRKRQVPMHGMLSVPCIAHKSYPKFSKQPAEDTLSNRGHPCNVTQA